MKILLVEDENNLAQNLKKYLENEKFEVLLSSNMLNAKKILDSTFDLVLLDWMLPDGEGINLIHDIKKLNLPIIILTARSDTVDKVLGLELGANDYMTKPIDPRELLARIKVQLRGNLDIRQKNELSSSNITLIISSREAFYMDKKIELTKTEFDLLKLLMENQNVVFSREELLNQVWGYNNYPTTRTVDNHILQLRQKTNAELFETLHGVGYKFKGQTNDK